MTQSGSLIACSDSKQQTQQSTMKLNEILNGNLEQQIRDGIERLATVATKGATPRIYISASADGNGFIAAGMQDSNGLSTDGLFSYGCNSIPEAVEVVIAKISSPEAIEKRRRELQDKIAKLQTELDAIPVPLSIVRDEPATVGA